MAKSSQSVVAELITKLRNKKEQVRLSAAKELFNLKLRAKTAVPELIVLLKDPSGKVRDQAARTLGQMGVAAKSAVSALTEALNDPASSDAALAALGAIGPDAADSLPFVVNYIQAFDVKHENYDAKASWHAHALAGLGPTAIPFLIEFVRQGNPELRQFSAFTLRDFGPSAIAAVPALVEALPGADRPLSCYTAATLAKIGAEPDVVVPALIKLLSSDDDEIRRAGVEAIGEFGENAAIAIPHLLPLLSEPNWFRLYGAEALGKVGPQANTALPSLQKLLSVKERPVREAAELAISRIGLAPVSEELAVKLAPAPDATTIDLARVKIVVTKMVADGLAEFGREHPDVEISCMALFGMAFGATTSLNFDTLENSNKQLADPVQGTYGEDRYGKFNTSIHEFAFVEYQSSEFKWWPSLYDVGSDFKIKLPDGRTVRRSTDKDGDDAINKPLFKLLRDILREASPIQGVRLATPFRLGVELYNSHCIEFWIPKKK